MAVDGGNDGGGSGASLDLRFLNLDMALAIQVIDALSTAFHCW